MMNVSVNRETCLCNQQAKVVPSMCKMTNCEGNFAAKVDLVWKCLIFSQTGAMNK